MSIAYVPVRDQNHVVRGKKPGDLFDVFYYFFEKFLKIKAKLAKEEICLVFFLF